MSSSAIDARGPQFNAAVTSVLLVVVLATAHLSIGVYVLAVQAALFASGVILGVQRSPLAWVFRSYVRPRLGPTTDWEDPRPPRFAQGIGLVFALVGIIGFTVGPAWLGYVATGPALVAALLNATVQFCLGCQIYGVCKLPQDRTQDRAQDHDITVPAGTAANSSDQSITNNKKEALA